MTPEDFEAALDVFERLSSELYRAYRSKRRAQLRDALAQLKELAGSDVMPYVQVRLGVFDRIHQRTIQFGWIDVSLADDLQLFVLGHDATPRTFLVDGKWCSLPEDQCPRCLGEWKLNSQTIAPCPACGAVLGQDLRIAIVNDRCPFCEDEQSPGEDVCRCGFEWNAEYAVRR